MHFLPLDHTEKILMLVFFGLLVAVSVFLFWKWRKLNQWEAQEAERNRKEKERGNFDEEDQAP
jgi:cbb3-type cytochrome oxidase subunit 3